MSAPRPGDVVMGTSNRRGNPEAIGRVIVIHREGGVMVEDDDGRIHGWNADDAKTLTIVERVEHAPTFLDQFGSEWLDVVPLLSDEKRASDYRIAREREAMDRARKAKP